ncbi:hypothetical protein SAMN04488063_2225 [Halopelagius inordinatus]|uniref:Uncharacterized protein n=1 Tax=Halopelagius inordinatus TaxID=553467 RepID=A0A1I2SI15_9EURY|nr:hypothetical protein [Halopelagius inordinatus]SFG49641.1 hypothetical protein SAMN04488063_2225 [Halopelagius inordinatus]
MTSTSSLHRTVPRRRPRAVVDPRPDVDVGPETAASERSRPAPARPTAEVSPRRATAEIDGRTDVR